MPLLGPRNPRGRTPTRFRRRAAVRRAGATKRRRFRTHGGGAPLALRQDPCVKRNLASSSTTLPIRHTNVLAFFLDPRTSVREHLGFHVVLVHTFRIKPEEQGQSFRNCFRRSGQRRPAAYKHSENDRGDGTNLLIQTDPHEASNQEWISTPAGRDKGTGGRLRGRLTWSARCDPSGQKWPGLQAPVQDDAVDRWDDPKRPEGHGKDVPPTQ